MANRIYEMVTQHIITKVEKAIQSGDILPWKKPWVYAAAPRNYVTQLAYRGVNTLLLDSGEYLTWNQFCDLQKHNPDLKIHKGCHQQIVVYFNFSEREKEILNAKGETEIKQQKVPYLKYYHVFSVKDIDGLPSKQKDLKFDFAPNIAAQTAFDNYVNREKIRVNYQNGDKACYSPFADTITLPKSESFKRSEAFYGTAYHEAVHSTGAKNRLDRLKHNHFGDQEYSKEELTAEMGASMLCARFGILTPSEESNSVAYMRGWITALHDNPSWLVGASSAAEKAVKFILNE